MKQLFLILLLGLLPFATITDAGFSIEPVRKTIVASDGYRIITYELKLETGFPLPRPKGYFFAIQGSNYDSVLSSIPRLAAATALGFTTVIVEKRGVDEAGHVNIQQAHQYSSKQTRVDDQLTVIREYLSMAEESLPIVLMGSSEGGDVAAAVAAREKRVTHLVLVGSGGGWTQAEEFEHFLKKKGSYLGLNSLEELTQKLDDIAAHPNSLTEWSGHPYMRWSSYLWDRNLGYLSGLSIPIVLFQGVEDDSVPYESARAVKMSFEKEAKTNLTYHEYASANHQFVDTRTGKSLHPYIEADLVEWLCSTKILNEAEKNEFVGRVKEAHPDLFPRPSF